MDDKTASGRNQFIPFALPSIDEAEIQAVSDVLRSGWLTTGPKTREFEQSFAASVGSRHALAVNSATAGLHLALEAIGITTNDLVLTPVWTFTASAEVTRYLGGHPVFVDSEPGTLNLDPADLEARILELRRDHRSHLKAIIPVHFAGQSADMNAILDLAESHGLKVIEDAAHAYPTTITCRGLNDIHRRVRKIGTVGHATVFSFYATKTIAVGEGGMVVTEDDQMCERMRTMRLHGINREVWNRYTSEKPSWWYEVVAPGYKYNLTDIASAIGLVQLGKAELMRCQREAIATSYNQAFANHPALEVPTRRHSDDLHAWHLYVLRLNLDCLRITREQFIAEMAFRGVGCSVHFIPLHLQPYWRERYNLKVEDFPVATREFERVVSLPIYPSMRDRAVKRVIDAVLEVVDSCPA